MNTWFRFRAGKSKSIICWKRLKGGITFEQKVPQRSDTSQNDHKSKGYPSKTSAAFTMQKSDRTPYASDFLLEYLKSG